MSESSRIETLLEALVDGENVDVEPQSRIETYLLALLNGDTNVKEPQSRIEAYLYQLCKNGMTGGGGGITPTGTLEITENGTHDVTNYASAEVNVASSGGGDLDALIDRSITEVSSNVESIGANAFQNCTSLTTADFPMATSIGVNAFYSCSNLTSVKFPQATSIGSYAFSNCYNLTHIDVYSLEKIDGSLFKGCRNLISLTFPKVTYTTGGSNFEGCFNLLSIDFSIIKSLSGSYIFSACYSLKRLILRSETMCTLSTTSAFNYCYHILGTTNSTYNPNGDKDGYIYVPRALIEDYKVATNWTTYATQFRALEDYTVDGTITGELDETKI